MRITIAPKLFLGFVVIIIFNFFFFVVVSNLEKINSITGILKLQTEIKNHLFRLKTLHRVQGPSVTSYIRLSRKESVENFNQTQKQIMTLYDSISRKLDSTVRLGGALTSNKLPSSDTQTISLFTSALDTIKSLNTRYISTFDSIVQSKNAPLNTTRSKSALSNKAQLKANRLSARRMEAWVKALEEQGDKITAIIDSAESIIDDNTNEQIKDVEQQVHEVREITIYIIIGVMAIALIFGLWFSTYTTNSLRRLTVSAGNIGKGDFDVDPHGYPKDEIGDLASAFFQMSVDLKNAQEALIRSKRLAAIGEIVASVNHEINNPLMIISGNAQFLQMTLGDASAETRDRVQTILEETERISKVTRKLREIKNPVIEDYTSSGEQMINLDKSST
jgi:nitrogen fixation/metabolism regulation signal transduction histidine kinase